MITLPLFPLSTLLYPGISMPMQIFEPRYIELVSDSLKQNRGFCIVAIERGNEVGVPADFYPVGTEVRIVDWYQQENNLLGIRVLAERKIKVHSSISRPNKLLIGEVEFLPSEPSIPLDFLGEELAVLAEQLKQHPAMAQLEMSAVSDMRTLGWQLAQLLPIALDEKARLLALEDPKQRVMEIARWVDRNANE